jgi:hypothetical protein
MIVPLAIRRLDHAPYQPGHATIPRKHLVFRRGAGPEVELVNVRYLAVDDLDEERHVDVVDRSGVVNKP